MKIRHALISTLFIATVTLTASQVAVVNAVSSASPITSPITSPVVTTTPLTPPVPTVTATPTPTPVMPKPSFSPTPTATTAAKPSPTSTPKPAAKYFVAGTVTRKFTISFMLGRKKHTYSFVIFAQNVTVKAVNQTTKKAVSVKANKFGAYSIKLEKGEYSISASDPVKTKFAPTAVKINLQKNTSQVNFQGK